VGLAQLRDKAIPNVTTAEYLLFSLSTGFVHGLSKVTGVFYMRSLSRHAASSEFLNCEAAVKTFEYVSPRMPSFTILI
jgi:hypothetical protein